MPGLTYAVAAQLRNLGLTLSSARAQAAILLRACAHARTATLPRSACLLPRRRPGLLLRALRIAARGASGRRRGTASKANALSPLITVVVSVCHSYRLVSCITCPSYKKDVQQMGLRVKSSVNGTKGAKHTASKTSLYASDEARARRTGGNNERQTVPFVPKTAPLICEFGLRSSHGRPCCAKAVS